MDYLISFQFLGCSQGRVYRICGTVDGDRRLVIPSQHESDPVISHINFVIPQVFNELSDLPFSGIASNILERQQKESRLSCCQDIMDEINFVPLAKIMRVELHSHSIKFGMSENLIRISAPIAVRPIRTGQYDDACALAIIRVLANFGSCELCCGGSSCFVISKCCSQSPAVMPHCGALLELHRVVFTECDDVVRSSECLLPQLGGDSRGVDSDSPGEIDMTEIFDGLIQFGSGVGIKINSNHKACNSPNTPHQNHNVLNPHIDVQQIFLQQQSKSNSQS